MASKQTWGMIAVVLIIVIAVTGFGQGTGQFDLGNLFKLGTQDGDFVDVNKQLKFHFIDVYSGGPIASKSNTFQLYDSDGKTLLEDNMDTDANGHCTTGSDYPSGKTMYVRYESSNDKKWWQFTIPQMRKPDAESATTNLIRLEGFTIGTYSTDDLEIANGTDYADASTYNCTGDGDNPHFVYELSNTGADDTGLMTSYDPVYKQNWNVEFIISFSGTDYEKLIIHNLQWDFTLGSTHYVGRTLDAYRLTKDKVGVDYESLGQDDIDFWIDTEGLTGSASVIMQIYAYAYADHDYAKQHGGTFGSEKVELAEHTVTIVDG